jgi:hypothetical protein
MQRYFARLATAIVTVTAATLVATTGVASAHEHRHVLGDKYELGVGWGEEPTYTGFKNSVTLEVSDHDGKPIADLKDIKVQVKAGDATADYSLEPAFGEPGLYEASMIPTRTGTYTFKFTGTIRGEAFDETFTSSETTFDSPKDATEVEFPAKDPSPNQLAQRLDREGARVKSLQTAAADAKDDASSAQTLAIVGIVLGALGLVAGGIGLTRKR